MNFIGTGIQALILIVIGGLLTRYAGFNMNMWMLTVILLQTIVNQNKITELEK